MAAGVRLESAQPINLISPERFQTFLAHARSAARLTNALTVLKRCASGRATSFLSRSIMTSVLHRLAEHRVIGHPHPLPLAALQVIDVTFGIRSRVHMH